MPAQNSRSITILGGAIGARDLFFRFGSGAGCSIDAGTAGAAGAAGALGASEAAEAAGAAVSSTGAAVSSAFAGFILARFRRGAAGAGSSGAGCAAGSAAVSAAGAGAGACVSDADSMAASGVGRWVAGSGFSLLLRQEQSHAERGTLEIEQVPVRVLQLQAEQVERADPALGVVEARAPGAPPDEAAYPTSTGILHRAVRTPPGATVL
jgi:hypothetical protein